MDILSFLETLEYTLNQITVNGEKNLDRLLGCIKQTQIMRNALIAKEEGEDDGRQTDITTVTDTANGDSAG